MQPILGNTWLLLMLWLVSCVQDADLRGPLVAATGDGDAIDPPLVAPCGEEERINPVTGECEPCIIRRPHPFWVCPCEFEFKSAPFPYCEGDNADYRCETDCYGGIATCNAFNSPNNDQTVRDCSQLHACCDATSESPRSITCCPEDEILVCYEQHGGYWPNISRCHQPTCCDQACETDEDCEEFQTCAEGLCMPGCEVCEESASACTCTMWEAP